MPGPLPKDPKTRRRRNPTPGFRQLPHEGRTGPTPPWPLIEHPNQQMHEAEQRKWQALWTLPQAIEWERMRCEDDVALYTRVWVEAQMPGAVPATATEVRQLDSKIGVSPRAMQQLRWETDEPKAEETEERPLRSVPEAKRVYVPATG